MISPETLRRYSFFGFMNDRQLEAIAMLSQQVTFEPGETIFEEHAEAVTLHFLLEGSLDHYFVVVDEINEKLRKELCVGQANAGEVFGISALIPPYRYTTTTRVTRTCRVITIDAAALRQACEADPRLAVGLMTEVAQAAMERLGASRAQLAVPEEA